MSLLVDPALRRLAAALEHHSVPLYSTCEIMPSRAHHAIFTLEILVFSLECSLQEDEN